MTISPDLSNFPITILPLENGDRLTRPEFELRYQAMPRLKKAELIEGRVYMSSPLRAKGHGEPHAFVIGWLFTYAVATPGVSVLDNPTVRLDADNELQPDAVLRIEVGGDSEGAPELIVEIAASSAAYDLHEKLKVYRESQKQNIRLLSSPLKCILKPFARVSGLKG